MENRAFRFSDPPELPGGNQLFGPVSCACVEDQENRSPFANGFASSRSVARVQVAAAEPLTISYLELPAPLRERQALAQGDTAVLRCH